MSKKRKKIRLAIAGLCVAILAACSNDTEQAEDSSVNADSTVAGQEISTVVEGVAAFDDEDYVTSYDEENTVYIHLNEDSAEVENSTAVMTSGSTVTIRAAGTYVLDGSLEDGQLVIDAEDSGSVHIILNGVSITNSSSSAIWIKQADTTIMTLAEGSQNTVEDGEVYSGVDEDGEPNAAVFSKDDLTINGSGSLQVTGNYNNGISSKDDLRIVSGTIEIEAADDGLMGRDRVLILDGSIKIDAGGDGIKSTNDEEKGDIALEGGTYTITAGNDGIQAEASLYITAGEYTIVTGEGSPEEIESTESSMGMPGEEQETEETETESESYKGLKANVDIAIADGELSIDSEDDAIHSDAYVTITGGTVEAATGDDGIHADTEAEIDGGSIDITKSYEGLEAETITINDGKIHLTASDDGVNASGGTTETEAAQTETAEESTGQQQGGFVGMMESSGTGELIINGGYLYVDAGGDGLDSNGSVQMTGGTVIVNGPTDSGNGSLDYDSDFTISGGILIAAGSSGMVQATSEDSEQSALLMTFSEQQEAGTLVQIADSEGNTVAAFTSAKAFQSILISTPDIAAGSDYTLSTGGSMTGTEKDGLYTEGSYQAGTEVISFTVTDTVTYLDESGVTDGTTTQFGGGGGRGGMNGGTPPDGEAPADGAEPPEMPNSGTTSDSANE